MKTKKLSEISDIQYGYAFDSHYFTNDNKYPQLVRIRDIKRGFSETYYLGKYDEDYVVHYGDLLIGMDGNFNISRWKSEDALLNQRVCKIAAKQDIIDEEYLQYALSRRLKHIEEKTAFVTVKHLSAKTLSNLKLEVPSQVEQIKIAQIISKISKAINTKKDELRKLDELIKARFVEMFGDPVLNSNDYKLIKLSNLGTLSRGKSKHRPRNDPKLLGGPYPLIQTGDITNSGIFIKKYNNTYSKLGLKQSKMWPAGTLCITIAANIAQTAILSFDACFPDSVVGFIPKADIITTTYLHYWFSFFQKILDAQASQVAQKNINLKVLSNLDVAVPPITEQDKFLSFVQQVDKSKFENIVYLNKMLLMKILSQLGDVSRD